MRALAFAALLLCASLPAAAQITSTRIESASWTCRDTEGRVLSSHERQDKAMEACTNRALKSPGTKYEVRPSGFWIVAQQTGSAALAWTPPNQNTDGSPLKNLAGYRVYWGPSQGSYPNSMTVAIPGLSSYVVDQLSAGTWYFVVTAFSSTGFESAFSNVASKTISF